MDLKTLDKNPNFEFSNFEFAVNLDEYKSAFLIRERRIGSLKKTPLVLVILALLALVCSYAIIYINTYSYSFLVLLFSLALFIIVAGSYFVVEPNLIKSTAFRNFEVHQKLMYPSKISFGVDGMTISTPYLKIVEQYAAMVCCVENPRFFLIIKDRERMYVIPKRELDSEQVSNLGAFLRTNFARKHFKMKSWIF